MDSGRVGHFGYLYRYTGLFTVISAHAVFDMVLLYKNYSQQKRREEEREKERRERELIAEEEE